MANTSGLYAAVSGAAVQSRRLEILANNLANLSTAGFKKDLLVFQEMAGRPRPPSPAADLVGIYREATDFSQGALQQTGNPLDLAVDGAGFFEILTARGPRYTRAGRFVRDAQNRLVTSGGDPVAGDGGPLVVDGSEIVIGGDGGVTVDGTAAGRIRIVHFKDTGLLAKVGDNLYENRGGQANLDAGRTSSVLQGYVEASNVNQVQEMVGLIEVSRAYETYQKVIQSMDEASRLVQERLGRP